MRKNRFGEEQIVRILQEAVAEVPICDLCREHSISEQRFYRWRSKFGGMAVADVRRLKALEAENGRLKRRLADEVLENDAVEAVIRKMPGAIRLAAGRDCPESASNQRAPRL